MGVVPSHCPIGVGGGRNTVGQDAGRVEAAGIGHEAVARASAVRGLEAHHAAEARGQADAAASVRAQGDGDEAGRHGRCTAARRAAGRPRLGLEGVGGSDTRSGRCVCVCFLCSCVCVCVLERNGEKVVRVCGKRGGLFLEKARGGGVLEDPS